MALISGVVLYQPLPPNMQRAFLREQNGNTSLLIDSQFDDPVPTASRLFFGKHKGQGANLTVDGTRKNDPVAGKIIRYSTAQ